MVPVTTLVIEVDVEVAEEQIQLSGRRLERKKSANTALR